MALLEVENLQVRFTTRDGTVHAVDGLDFRLEKGETLGVVGESGSGKSQAMLAIMGLLADNGRARGRIRFLGERLDRLPPAARRRLRGNRMGMIFQDPQTSLNGHLSIERQLTEVLQVHQGLSRRQGLDGAEAGLAAVGIPDPARRIRRYPHEFSGGMRQRVMIAMTLLCQPDLLIADEPTTALDVTVQAQILDLLADLQKRHAMSILLITHDLGVIARLSDRVLVMYGGRACEEAPVERLFDQPHHPYTRALLGAVPRLDLPPGARLAAIPGQPPTLLGRPGGCPFHDRCPEALPRCRETPPAARWIAPDHRVFCHLEGDS